MTLPLSAVKVGGVNLGKSERPISALLLLFRIVRVSSEIIGAVYLCL